MVTRLSHATIFVLDQEVAHDFYVNKLGFKVHTDAMMGETFRWLTVTAPKNPDLEIILMKVGDSSDSALGDEGSKLMKEMLASGHMGVGVLECDDCRATYEDLRSKGVKFSKEPTDEFYGTEAIFSDPFGNWFSMSQRKDH